MHSKESIRITSHVRILLKLYFKITEVEVICTKAINLCNKVFCIDCDVA